MAGSYSSHRACWKACYVSSFFCWSGGNDRGLEQLSHHWDITRCRWYQASCKEGTGSRSRCPSAQSSWPPQYYLWPRDEIANSSLVENAGFPGFRQWYPSRGVLASGSGHITAYREHPRVASSMSCSNFNSTSFLPAFPGSLGLMRRSDGDGLMLYALHIRVDRAPLFFSATMPSLALLPLMNPYFSHF